MFGAIKRLMPSRQKYTEAANNAVADLDAILVEPVSFKLHGKIHIIKPLDVQQFMLLTKAIIDFQELQSKDAITPSELIDRYYSLMNGVCPSIKRKDIEDMTHQQVAALYDLVMNTITGKIFEEKKTLKMATKLKPA